MLIWNTKNVNIFPQGFPGIHSGSRDGESGDLVQDQFFFYVPDFMRERVKPLLQRGGHDQNTSSPEYLRIFYPVSWISAAIA